MLIFTSFVLAHSLHIKRCSFPSVASAVSLYLSTFALNDISAQDSIDIGSEHPDSEEAHRSAMEITADPTMLPLEGLTRDEDFWLKDGTVVLVAKKTAFKVYSGLLAAHSPVFDDMFSFATHADEMYDGCPVVRIPDSPEHFKWVLTHLIPRTLLQCVCSFGG